MSTRSQLSKSPIHLLHRVSQCVTEIFQNEVHAELTARQLMVLATVARNEGLSQTDIVDQTHIDRSTIADMVRRLQKKGLVQRRRSKSDARAYTIKLTDEGRRMLNTAEPLAKRVDERILRALGSGRGSDFIDTLASLVRRLEGSQQA